MAASSQIGNINQIGDLATCCDDDYDVLLDWEPWANAMLAILLPKLWIWIENHDWHNCFWMSLWLFVGWNPYRTQKSFKINNFYIIDWIRKKIWSMLPISLLATMKYNWMFLEPYIGGKADERAHKRTLTKQFPIEPTWCFTRAKLAPKCPCHTMCSQRQVSWISAPKPKH